MLNGTRVFADLLEAEEVDELRRYVRKNNELFRAFVDYGWRTDDSIDLRVWCLTWKRPLSFHVSVSSVDNVPTRFNAFQRELGQATSLKSFAIGKSG